MRVDNQPAYIIHTKKISDSRLIIELLTRDYGVISAIARAPGKKKPPFIAFAPTSISWVGKTELKTLTGHEHIQYQELQLAGASLYCGFYLNELLQRLVSKDEACEELYQLYQVTLLKLALDDDAEPLLRAFEFLVLKIIGLAIDFNIDAVTGKPVEIASFYTLRQGAGFIQCSSDSQSYLGAHLIAISTGDYSDLMVRRVAKKISRALLKPVLGSRPLKSRELFKAPCN